MSEKSETRQQSEQVKPTKHLAIISSDKFGERNTLLLMKVSDCSIHNGKDSNAYNDIQRHRRRAVQKAHSPEEAPPAQGSSSRSTLTRHEASRSQHCNSLLKKTQPKTDKEVKKITRDAAIKYLRKLKHFTLSIKKTAAVNLSRNIYKQKIKLNIKRASTALLCITNSQTCNLKFFASNTLYRSYSNRPIRLNEEIPNETSKNKNLQSTAANLLKYKLNHFCKSQIPYKCQRKQCKPIILNFSFRCRCDSSNSQLVKNKLQQPRELSTSSTMLSASTDASRNKRTQFQPQARIQSALARTNGDLIQYRNKNTKTISKQKSRKLTFSRNHRCLMSRIYSHKFTQKYQTYFAELDYNNLALELSQASRQAVGIGSTCDFSIDFGRSTIPDFSVNGEPQDQHGQVDSINTNQERVSKKQSLGKHDHLGTAVSSRSTGSKHQPFECSPGVCVPGKCDPSECFKRLKKGAPYGSHASTQSRKYEIREKKTIRGKVYNRKSAGVIKRTHGKKDIENTQLQRRTRRIIPFQGVSHRGPTRIGSKLSFNIQFYKDSPLDSRSKKNKNKTEQQASKEKRKVKRKLSSAQFEQGDTIVHHKADIEEKRVECEPGVCVPGKCNPSECYQRIKATHVSTRTDKSLTASSHGTSHSSQTSTQLRNYKGRDPQTGKETFFKEKGVSSIPRDKQTLNIPNRQAVRIGSKCSFNVEFYKSLPNGPTGNYEQNFQPQARLNKSPQPGNNEVTLVSSFVNLFSNKKFTRKNKSPVKALKQFQCEPGVCIPGKCYPIDCYQRIKVRQITTGTDTSLAGSSNSTSHGSQASTKTSKSKGQAGKATFYKEKGASSMPRPKNPLHIPNRQAVRIGSKCSFNIEFYKSMPHNGHMMNRYDNLPAIALANKINTESNKMQVRKNQYPGLYDQGDGLIRQTAGTGKKSKTLKQYQCEPGVCIPGRCNPNECFFRLKTKHEGSGTDASFSSSSNGTSHGSQALNKMPKNNKTRVFKTGKASFFKDKGAPSMRQPRIQLQDVYGPKAQVVRIGSKCSFNIEFYKSMPQSHPIFNEQNYQPVPAPVFPNKATTERFKKKRQIRGIHDQGDTSVKYMSGIPGNNRMALRGKTRLIKQSSQKYGEGDMITPHIARTGKKIKVTKRYECEPGVCIPDKCDPNECFARLKTRHEGTSTDASLAASSNATSYDSQTSTQTKKRKKIDRRKRAGKETFYKDKAASTLPRSKMPLHIPNRQVVRIGSKCSFNVEFYKDMSKNGLTDSNGKRVTNRQFPEQYNKMGTALKPMVCEPGVCVPSRCDPNECYQRLTGTPWAQSRDGPTPSHTDGDQRISGPSGPQPASSGRNQQIGSPGRPKTDGKGKNQRISEHRGGRQTAETGTDQQIGGASEQRTASTDRNQKANKPSKHETASSTSSKDQRGKAKKTTGTEKKSKMIKGKIKMKKESPGKHDHGDAAVQHKVSTEKKSKILKEKTKQVKQPNGHYDQGDAADQLNLKGKRNKSSKEKPKRIKPPPGQFDQDDKQFACELGVCIPDKCDPNECFERLKSKHEGTSTDASLATRSTASHSSEVATQSKIAGVNLGKKNKAGRQRRAGKEHFVKEKGTSSITNSNKKISMKDIPLHTVTTRSARNRQVVRIGSSCSFNIEFYKEKSRPGSQVNPELVTIAPKPEPSEIQVNNHKKGIVPFIKKCYCQLSTKQKSVSNKQAPMLYDQGSNTDEPMTVSMKKNTKTKPTLQKFECEPGVCVYGKCDPNECYQRLKPTHASLSSIKLQSAGPGKQRNTMRRYECRLGVCIPNKCDPNECFERERSYLIDAGTDTSPKAKSTATYGTNAATQSRRYPALQQTVRREPFRSAVCKCVAKIGPSTATTRIRQQTEQVLAAHRQSARNNGNFNMYLGPNMGYGDNFFGGRVKEKAVILGSGCSFNLKYFGKKKKKNRK